ncbi:inhibitor of apoptosis 5 [Erinnyis ello granulovirus]|uniref:Inhibitor of apoptosis 5 n=1 Tax=Erinnyis ello granulovirus TaxID=307444 RepID=A0A097DAR3_9BBAC|nr:inhibitor of apoptosis 5 [Erinnyis ello granulovirus]AIS92109.1 inhibitor of apoptosis 5 [Erinnyis ello granulovirus]ARX71450.1 inhibitor of apoptosis 5 [Erinnyis ello granulovirus]ARX71580.1 inhibitor of apoptosis 5 [Erinnyis ello granulovirus]ARX71710.1 inhibitor of apoptosis 5 [Erinnyis ello granulovirus]ARX71840.1 inhibitor of apoptosis 5 [Erinnyis ello granulovirus]
MHCYENRLKSFENWTGCENVEDLATVGFYHTGYKDTIMCYYCKYTDYNYTTGNEDTLFNHKRYSPDCCFYTFTSAENFLTTKFNTPRTIHTNFTLDHIDHVIHRDYSLAEHRVNSYVNFPKILKHLIPQLSECGFYYTNCSDVVVCYACNVHARDLQINTNAWQLHKSLNNNCPLLYVRKQHNICVTDSGAGGGGDNEQIVVPSAPEYRSYHYTLPKCLNCGDRYIDAVLLPCYHFCVCQECALTCVQCKACNVFVGGFFMVKIPTTKLNVVEYGQFTAN